MRVRLPHISFALLLIPLSAALGQKAENRHGLTFINLSPVYYSFEHIRPILANAGGKSVYLSSFHPQAAAQLVRFNEDTGGWEYGAWTRLCASVANVTKPIEVLPGGSFQPRVLWQYSMDDWGNPTAFVTRDEEKRHLKGRYKIALRYAEEPWMLGNSPKRIHIVSSAEFVVEP